MCVLICVLCHLNVFYDEKITATNFFCVYHRIFISNRNCVTLHVQIV